MFTLFKVVNTIREENLLDRVQTTGAIMMKGLTNVQNQFPNLISAVRGRGTFCAMDLPTTQQRDKFLADLRRQGVHLGGCGEKTVRFRPSLTFNHHHANIMLEKIEQVVKMY